MNKSLFKIALLVCSLFTGILFAQESNPVKFKIESKKGSDTEYDIVFNATIANDWHVYSITQTAEGGPNPTIITLNKSADYELVGKVKESTPIQEMDKVFEMKVAYFKNKATFTQRIKVKTGASFEVSGKYEFQVCT